MTPQFLRHEAARFRGMAEEADREATKARLLAMAVDYEARAGIDNELPEPNSAEAGKAIAEPDPSEAVSELAVPDPGEVLKLNPGRKITSVVRKTELMPRRPVGRPRRE